MKAFVQVKTVPGWQAKLVQHLENARALGNKAIKDIEVIYGEYDVMVVIESEERLEFNKALALLTKQSGVASTNTNIVMPREDARQIWQASD